MMNKGHANPLLLSVFSLFTPPGGFQCVPRMQNALNPEYFLIGAEIASGIDVMKGLSRQPMGKFVTPRGVKAERGILNKYMEISEVQWEKMPNENQCRYYGTLKI